MDKITNNIVNNIPKKDLKDAKATLNIAVDRESKDKTMSSNVVDIKDTKILVREMAKIMNSKVNIKLIDSFLENELIDTGLLQSLDNKKIVSDQYYYKKVLKKYLL